MALLTLVENAVRHGIDPLEQGGRIERRARATAAACALLSVADTGAGLDPRAASPAPGWPTCANACMAFYGPRRGWSWRKPRRAGCARDIVLPERD
jgi:LytS/YehU family sensor histidine kinase